MLLCIDVGNTHTVLAAFAVAAGSDSGGAAEEPAHTWRIRTDAKRTADELALLYHGLLAESAIVVTGIATCSSVPAVLRELRSMFPRYFPGVPAVIIEPGTRTGVRIATDNPKEVGTDRVMNTLATFRRYGGPSIVVDFGTSTNFDVVGPAGEFLGGALAPGIEISVDALAARAAQLRKVELVRPSSVIGKNTVESLQSGILFGFAGQVDGLVRRLQAELGSVHAVVATGGLAPLVISECATITHHEPNLTLLGLQVAFAKNLTPAT